MTVPLALILAAGVGSGEATPSGRTQSDGHPKAKLAAAKAIPSPHAGGRLDTPDEARGRLTLSTAFVRIGPDGHLQVSLNDGRTLALRNVTMGPRRFCGNSIAGPRNGARICTGYAEVLAARAGG